MIDKSEMIFGVRAVIEAIQAGKEIDKILVKKDIQSELSKELFAALKGRTYQPHYPQKSSGSGSVYFLRYLPEDGRSCTFSL